MFGKEKRVEVTKFRHPEAPTESDEIWSLIFKLWNEFENDRPQSWEQWQKDEGLDGFMQGFEEHLPKFLAMDSNASVRNLDKETLVHYIAGVAVGVRLGNAIAKEKMPHPDFHPITPTGGKS